MTFNSKPTSRKSKDHMAVTVSPATADVASEKIRVPIYFSKKMSKLKQVRTPTHSNKIRPCSLMHPLRGLRFLLVESVC